MSDYEIWQDINSGNFWWEHNQSESDSDYLWEVQDRIERERIERERNSQKREISHYLNLFKDVVTTPTYVEFWFNGAIEKTLVDTFENAAKKISAPYAIRTPIINGRRITLDAGTILFQDYDKDDEIEFEAVGGWSWDEIRCFFGGDWRYAHKQTEDFGYYRYEPNRPPRSRDRKRTKQVANTKTSACNKSVKPSAPDERRELCNRLWKVRDIITQSTQWTVARSKNYAVAKTFQDVARNYDASDPSEVDRLQMSDSSGKMKVTFEGTAKPPYLRIELSKERDKPFTYRFSQWSLSEIHRFLGGCWFEEYVYYLADDIKASSQSITSITKGEMIFDHEIDVLVRTNKRVYLIECKTGAVDVEVVKKLKNLADAYTSQKKVEAIGLLVSLNRLESNGAVAQFVKQSNRLACMHGDNIPNRMRNLLTTQSKSFLG